MHLSTGIIVLLVGTLSDGRNNKNNASCHAFTSNNIATTTAHTANNNNNNRRDDLRLFSVAEPPPGGISATATTTAEGETTAGGAGGVAPSSSSSAGGGGEDATKRVGINSLGAKMNEIDFTLAPADVSLSRCYQNAKKTNNNNNDDAYEEEEEEEPKAQQQQQQARTSKQSSSLTRALNTASNRAVRRVLLSRSWPSAEALNLSLRTVLMQQRKRKEEEEEAERSVVKAGLVANGNGEDDESDRRTCPVPRPILNILVNRSSSKGVGEGETTKGEEQQVPTPRMSGEEREAAWIRSQIAVFRESYGAVEDYDQAEAYLESVLSLATSGEESGRVEEVYEGGTYKEPYERVLSVIRSVGAVLEEVPKKAKEGGEGAEAGGTVMVRRIAQKLIDQDFCLSMLDKIALANERNESNERKGGSSGEAERETENPVAIPYDAAAKLAFKESDQSLSFEEFETKYMAERVAMVSAKWDQGGEDEQPDGEVEVNQKETKTEEGEPKRKRSRLAFWRNNDVEASDAEAPTAATSNDETAVGDEMETTPETETETADALTSTPPVVINPDDLGGVLLSAEEPTVTRQLNVLSNIVQRTLIFGGDQELLVLAETLDADRPAFLQRWYAKEESSADASDADDATNPKEETRPGAQYLDSLIRLLRDCYAEGVLKEMSPSLPMNAGYRNAYGRLTASLVERGSGYVRPTAAAAGSGLVSGLTTAAATARYLTSTKKPKSAREELGRFAKWETAVRKNRENPYPDDLVGTWNVQDVVGTQTIGTTEVTFKPRGELSLAPPVQGLRWRLDPGPTHLDTCTFQVLSEDGAILQYKGFVDRGSRLEARVSKRSVTMRGGVSFLMRDADGVGDGIMDNDYWDDMVPMNYKSGATKFVMSRNVDVNGNGSAEYGSSSGGASSSSRAPLKLKCPPVAEGEREILDGPNGPVLVTKVAGSYYAVDATCPHLGLPMKKGKISAEGRPTLTCSFHNSCFELRTGKCTKWVTGALGSENDVVAGIMGGLGSERKDITAYGVSEEGDGSLTVTTEISEASKVAA